MEKKCKKCNVVKDVSEFHKSTNKDGFRNKCKLCNKEEYQANKEKIKQYYQSNKQHLINTAKKHYKDNKEKIKERKKEYYEANKEELANKSKQYYQANKSKQSDKGKQYYQANKEHLAKKNKEYYEANRERIKERKNKYYKDNKERIIDKSKEYRKDNKEKISVSKKEYFQTNKEQKIKYSNQYVKSRRKTDNLFRLKMSTRRAAYRYLKGSKSKKTREIIGIDFKGFQDYLGVEYIEGMHLDHIIPLSWASNDEEVYILNHYSNFQIITAEDNLAKSDTYCKSENLKKVLDNHNNLTKLNKIIERNSDKIS